ncbi:hypothetical protein WJX72_011433 [[Myrmecia] bisecta]|uniref:Uncharacterized protein n=1 Tax=[Myrmecia] bisecta TaxID=41462 RepID=A0AAW1NY33_9CHLO
MSAPDGCGLEPLSSLTALTCLLLSRCDKVSGAGLSALLPLRHLQSLNLREGKLSSGALRWVGPLPSLTQLDVSENQKLSDSAMKHLTKLTALRRLCWGCGDTTASLFWTVLLDINPRLRTTSPLDLQGFDWCAS